MFLSRNKKNNIYPCKPQFYYIKVGFKGVKIIKVCFRDDYQNCARKNNSLIPGYLHPASQMGLLSIVVMCFGHVWPCYNLVYHMTSLLFSG